MSSATASPIPETIEQVIAWLETRPLTETYDPANTHSCVLCHYMDSHGARRPQADFTSLGHAGLDSYTHLEEDDPLSLVQRWWVFAGKGFEWGVRPNPITVETALYWARRLRDEPDLGAPDDGYTEGEGFDDSSYYEDDE